MSALASLKSRVQAARSTAAASPLLLRWQQLPARDRLALSLLAVFMLLMALYAAIWLPLQREVREAREWYQSQRELHQYVLANAPQARQQGGEQQVRISAEQLQGVVTSSAQQAGISIERYDSDGSGLSLSLSRVPFARLLPWLLELERQGVNLLEVNLDRGSEGRVDVRLSLSAGN